MVRSMPLQTLVVELADELQSHVINSDVIRHSVLCVGSLKRFMRGGIRAPLKWTFGAAVTFLHLCTDVKVPAFPQADMTASLIYHPLGYKA